MPELVCKTLSEAEVSHVPYASSDSVHPHGETPITGRSSAAPDNLHGMMHATREMMLKTAVTVQMVVVLHAAG